MTHDYKKLLAQMQQAQNQAMHQTRIYNGDPFVSGNSSYTSATYITPKSSSEILSEQIADLWDELRQRDRYLAHILQSLPDVLTLAEFKNYEAVAKRFREATDKAMDAGKKR